MQYKIKAKKHLSQNFLQDENTIQKIVRLSNIQQSDIVLEIGPGLGALTRYLLQESDNVNVVEYDSSIIDKLISNCSTYGTPKIYNEDFLKFDTFQVSQDKIKIIGNLPYNISTPILFRVIAISDQIIDAHFMLQKEVVDRIISQPNSKVYGRLSVILQYHFQCSLVLKIAPEMFYPKPKVNSAILKLKPRVDKPILKNPQLFSQIIKSSFAHRRKTLHNNLKDIIVDKDVNLEFLPIDTRLRAENLSVDDYVNLSNFLS